MKYLAYEGSDESLTGTRMTFGQDPLKHHLNLVGLYEDELQGIIRTILFKQDESKKKADLIKESINKSNEQVKKFPIFKFPPNDCKSYLNLKKNKIVKRNSKFQCHFCEETFDRFESLGGHNKLHTDFK